MGKLGQKRTLGRQFERRPSRFRRRRLLYERRRCAASASRSRLRTHASRVPGPESQYPSVSVGVAMHRTDSAVDSKASRTGTDVRAPRPLGLTKGGGHIRGSVRSSPPTPHEARDRTSSRFAFSLGRCGLGPKLQLSPPGSISSTRATAARGSPDSPFPVPVVEWVAAYAKITRKLFAFRCVYHHRYVVERELVGFGTVEQRCSELLHAAPPGDVAMPATNPDDTFRAPSRHFRTLPHPTWLPGQTLTDPHPTTTTSARTRDVVPMAPHPGLAAMTLRGLSGRI